MGLRKPTQMKRRTVDTTGRVIVPTEPGVPVTSVRRVHIVVPEQPQIFLCVAPQEHWEGDIAGVDDSGTTPSAIAHGRTFQWPEVDGGAVYKFKIRADQTISAMCDRGLASLTVICEYCEKDR
jgi:hypothetical protein